MKINNIEERIQRGCDFEYLQKKYPHVAFNVSTWKSKPNDRAHDKRHLIAAEGYITLPRNFDINYIKQYDTYITFNSKFIETYKNEHPNMVFLLGNTFWNDYYELGENEFVSYEDKLKGVLILNKLYHTGSEGDIVYLREKILNELNVSPKMIKHVFSYNEWGGQYYQGNLPYPPNHIINQRKLSEYLFCLCFESCYHPFWSWDWITERIINCFRTKTIPIYLGCYNIEEHIPTNLFIDYRQFNFDNNKLSEYLLDFTEEQYNEMSEAAYDWYKNKNPFATILDFEHILENLQ